MQGRVSLLLSAQDGRDRLPWVVVVCCCSAVVVVGCCALGEVVVACWAVVVVCAACEVVVIGAAAEDVCSGTEVVVTAGACDVVVTAGLVVVANAGAVVVSATAAVVAADVAADVSAIPSDACVCRLRKFLVAPLGSCDLLLTIVRGPPAPTQLHSVCRAVSGESTAVQSNKRGGADDAVDEAAEAIASHAAALTARIVGQRGSERCFGRFTEPV